MINLQYGLLILSIITMLFSLFQYLRFRVTIEIVGEIVALVIEDNKQEISEKIVQVISQRVVEELDYKKLLNYVKVMVVDQAYMELNKKGDNNDNDKSESL
mgnify:CR=1 FL=1